MTKKTKLGCCKECGHDILRSPIREAELLSLLKEALDEWNSCTFYCSNRNNQLSTYTTKKMRKRIKEIRKRISTL